MANQEAQPDTNNERREPLQQKALEYSQNLKVEQEQSVAEREPGNPEKQAQDARHEIEKITTEQEPKKQEKADTAPAHEKIVDTKVARKKAYESIMHQARSEMSAPSRAFSKVIHNPVIEKTSELAGKTIARPNAILSGAVFAFLLTTLVYLIARLNGYPLTGTETIASFIIGWILGNVYDFVRAAFTGRH